MNRSDSQRHIVDAATVVVLAVGFVLRLSQYARRGELWLDEAMVAISIVGRSMRALIFSPLEYNQMAPPLFLQLSKVSTMLLGPTEDALRLPALVFSLLALVLFAALARELLEPLESLSAILLFAVSPMLVLYSAEAKQYAGDVFSSVLLIYVVVRLRRSRYAARWVTASVLSGLSLVWLADSSSIMLAGLGAALLLLAWLDRGAAPRAVAVIAPFWCAAVLAAYLGARRRMVGGTADTMQSYWRDGFMPVPPRSWDGLIWAGRAIQAFYEETLAFRPLFGTGLALAVLGLFSLWRRGKRDTVTLLVGPVLVAFVASGARVYPFAGRLSLFLLPAFVVAAAAGIAFLTRPLRQGAWAGQVAILGFLLTPSIASLGRIPAWRQREITPVLRHVKAQRLAGDAIYLFGGAGPAAWFYGARMGMRTTDWRFGPINASDSAASAKDVDSLRGRIWIIVSHDRPEERSRILRQLDASGSRLDEFPRGVDLSQRPAAFLYYIPPPSA